MKHLIKLFDFQTCQLRTCSSHLFQKILSLIGIYNIYIFLSEYLHYFIIKFSIDLETLDKF